MRQSWDAENRIERCSKFARFDTNKMAEYAHLTTTTPSHSIIFAMMIVYQKSTFAPKSI